MDTQFPTYGDPPITALVVGPKFISESLYNLSPLEDQALGHLSVRPGSLFMEDLAIMEKFSDEKFGSVPRVYVIAAEDKPYPHLFRNGRLKTIQWWR
ncbi:UNVERIFIED_CONTAM: Salicylic acid-binding protein 2 [Sesamum radiatum]|uniref:Salicylic acid-binding protein 2 n=1 Tax=Sesamum radiatum TaxID=300843 RepID=A0AAW2PFU4_SESRA